jgi:hypothetical protein
MLPKLHFQYIAFFSFVVIFLNWLLFFDLSVDFIFLFGNFIVVVISLVLISYCQKNYIKLNEKRFIKKIFRLSLGLRVFAMLFYYSLFYYITGTEFDIEAQDAVWYDEIAQLTSASLLDGTFSWIKFLIDVKGNFDDSGYILFLSIIYSIFDNSIIIARLIQTLISAFTVVLIYKIGKDIFGEKTAKITAILTASFQPLLLYASIHLKETLMIYFLLLFIYHSIQLLKKHNFVSVIVILFSFFALLSFRTVVGLTALVSLIGYLMISGKYSIAKKGIVFFTMCIILYFLVINISLLDDVVEKAKRYAGMQTESKVSVGGTSQDGLVSGGQSFAKYAGGGVFLLQSIVMPYPSMVKTNIVFYNQTLQWYFAGGLLIWVFLSYYAYVGIYYSVKNHFKETSILIFISGMYTAALIASFYMTSIRFSIVKLILLLPFVAFGIVSSNKKIKGNFVKYAIVMCIIVLIWNYVKIAGRGLV